MAEKQKKSRKRKGERKDGRIQVTYTDGRKPDGTPNRIPFYGRTREEANTKREEYKKKRGIGIAVDADKMTVGEWIDKWLATYKSNIKGKNKSTYLIQTKALKEHLGKNMLLKNVRNADLQHFMNQLYNKSESGISKRKMVVTNIFSKARINKLIVDDPAEDLDMPQGTQGKHRALERWEADIILQHWQSYKSHGLCIMLMLLCGLRRGEVVPLNWDDIDMVNRQLTVHAAAEIIKNQTIIKPYTKTDAGMRTLPICEPLFQALNMVPEEKRHGLICLSAHRKQLSESALDRGLEGFLRTMERLINNEPLVGKRKNKKEREEEIEAAAKAKAEGRKRVIFNFRYHDLRYTFATALYDAGVPLKAAQYYLGHSDIKMTMDLYTQLSKEREQASSAALTTYLDAWLAKEIVPQNPL